MGASDANLATVQTSTEMSLLGGRRQYNGKIPVRILSPMPSLILAYLNTLNPGIVYYHMEI